jgi:hypothetical protein
MAASQTSGRSTLSVPIDLVTNNLGIVFIDKVFLQLVRHIMNVTNIIVPIGHLQQQLDILRFFAA